MTQVLYNQDFYAWTKQQASLLQAEELEQLDIPNLIEEIESMGKSQRRELDSRLTILLMHLLKLQQRPTYSGNSWYSTVDTQRREIGLVLRDSPSLRCEVLDGIAYAYPRARKDAARETKSALATFPTDCPWTVEEILDEDWLPV